MAEAQVYCLWGPGEGHIPESLPHMPWPCLAESNSARSSLRDRDRPFLGLDHGCPLSRPG